MSPENRRIALVAGGTGGHIYPGIALAQEIPAQDNKLPVPFIGSDEGLESELVPRAGFVLKTIRARALLRKISYKALSAPFVSLIGFFQALSLLRSFSPRALISTGAVTRLHVLL